MKPLVAIFYFSDPEIMKRYELELRLQNRSLKLRDAKYFNEENREYGDEVYIAPDIEDDVKSRIAEHFMSTTEMEVMVIDDESSQDDEDALIDPVNQDAKEVETTDDPNLTDVEAQLAAKQKELEKREGELQAALEKQRKEESEAEAATLRAEAEESEAEQARKETEVAKAKAQDAKDEKTKIELVTALKEAGVQIPRGATRDDLQKLYDDKFDPDLGLDD